MSLTQHPLASLFDATAARGEPSADELDDLADDLIRSTASAMTPADLRRRIKAAVVAIVEARERGHSGEARRIGRDTVAELVGELGPYEPARPADDRPIKEIVGDVPRFGGAPGRTDPEVQKAVDQIPRSI